MHQGLFYSFGCCGATTESRKKASRNNISWFNEKKNNQIRKDKMSLDVRFLLIFDESST